MDALLLLLGRIAGFAGLLFCVAAVAIRLAGNYYVGSFQVVTFLEGGVTAIVVGCFFLLLVLTGQGRAGRSR